MHEFLLNAHNGSNESSSPFQRSCAKLARAIFQEIPNLPEETVREAITLIEVVNTLGPIPERDHPYPPKTT